MKSLFFRTLIAFFSALLIFLFIVAGAFLLGFNRSMRQWSEQRKEETERLFSNKLLEVMVEKGIDNPVLLTPEELHLAFRPHLRDSLYVFVVTLDKSGLLYGYRRGERIDVAFPGGPGGTGGEERGGRGPRALERSVEERDFIQRHFEESIPFEVKLGDDKVALISAGPVSFDADRANRRLVESVSATLVTGIAVALFMAFLFAFLFSSRLSRHAKQLSAGLNALAGGDRMVDFPAYGSRELKQIAISAAVLRDRLKKEEDLRRTWAADIAHDLRTPLSAVKAQLEGFMEGVLEPSARRFSLTYGEMLRMERLVDDLAVLTRLESPELKLNRKRFAVSDFLSEIRERFSAEAERKGVGFSVDGVAPVSSVTPGTPAAKVPEIEGDRDLLLRAVSNLVRNGIQYCAPGGAVTVTAEQADEETIFSISNEGSVPEEDVPRLFERLFRGERSRHTPGSGLGLSIAKAAADLHGAGLAIRNLPEGRVEAVLTIPL